MTATRTCELPPFLSPVVAQVATLEQAGSSLEILTQTLENYMASFKAAICEDFIQIVDECCGGGPTEISFLDLTDTPDSYAGAASQFVKVNAGETGLEFATYTPPDQSFLQLTDTPASYAGAAGQIVVVNPGETGLIFTSNIVPEPVPVTCRLVCLLKPLSGTTLGVTGVSVVGAPVFTLGGASLSHPALANTNVLTSSYRVRLVSSAAAGNAASIRNNLAPVLRGNAAGVGGFRMIARFGTSTALAQQRLFVGMSATTGALANANPSTFVDLVGVSYDSTQTTLYITNNDNAGGGSSVSLGANFPVDNASMYEVEIWCEPNAATIEYRVLNIGTGDQVSGSLNSELPTNTTFLGMQCWVNNGTTASAAQLDVTCLYLETYS